MADNTPITWADATLNHGIGCTKATYEGADGKLVVHPGCERCYAEKWARRYRVLWGANQPRRVKADWSQPQAWLRAAIKAKTVRTVFWESLGDILDEEMERQPALRESFDRTCEFFMQAAPSRNGGCGLRALALTKRPERFCLLPEDLRPEVWFGTSIADQATARLWIARLREATDFRGRFLSVAPQVADINLLEQDGRIGDREHFVLRQACGQPRDLIACTACEGTRYFQTDPFSVTCEACRGTGWAVDWVLHEGEFASGGKARPFRLRWARELRDQCRAAGVPYHLKQVGSKVRLPYYGKGNPYEEWDYRLRERALDGPHRVMVGESEWECHQPPPDAELEFSFRHPKGGDEAEWPEDLRGCRAFPEVF